jgi:hypothetical protein
MKRFGQYWCYEVDSLRPPHGERRRPVLPPWRTPIMRGELKSGLKFAKKHAPFGRMDYIVVDCCGGSPSLHVAREGRWRRQSNDLARTASH